MTLQAFPGLENATFNFQDFPGCVGTLEVPFLVCGTWFIDEFRLLDVWLVDSKHFPCGRSWLDVAFGTSQSCVPQPKLTEPKSDNRNRSRKHVRYTILQSLINWWFWLGVKTDPRSEELQERCYLHRCSLLLGESIWLWQCHAACLTYCFDQMGAYAGHYWESSHFTHTITN